MAATCLHKKMSSNIVNSTRIELLTNDNNYDSWCVQAEALLTKTDGWSYVSGDTPKPELSEKVTAADVLQWQYADKKAKADIILSVSPDIAKRVGKLETSRDVWLHLKDTFASAGPVKRSNLLHMITVSRMSEEDNSRVSFALLCS